MTNVHDAKLQMCRATVDGRPLVRLRLDNRAGKHRHRGGLFRDRGGRSQLFEVRAAKGRFLRTARVPVRTTDGLGTLVGEIGGPAAGGGVRVSELPPC